jgi:hypothetical protein
MTETEWLTAAHPWDMIAFASGTTTNRKLRLFACACCRQVCNDFLPPLVLRAVAAAEAFADREISADTLAQVREVVAGIVGDANREDARAGTGYLSHVLGACLSICSGADVMELAQDTAHSCAFAAGDVAIYVADYQTRPGRTRRPLGPDERPPEIAHERAIQADLLRDIAGNPFQSLEMQPEWFTDTAVALARQMYDSREFSAMPILADALQDAGCDDDDILNHCREAREHVRGCWVVDLLLGKS